jgi:hypothetical protein
MWLFPGAGMAIRNAKAHPINAELDKQEALDGYTTLPCYLGF